MGQCFSAMKGPGGSKSKTGKLARPTNSNHMGPEGVESSIFLGKDSNEPLFPKRDPLSPGQDHDVNAELAPLNELVPGVNGAEHTSPRPPPKQAVMRRSFPPVGVSLDMSESMEEIIADPQRMAQVESEISQTIANIFKTPKERIRIMQVKPSEPPGSVTINLNIVADRTDSDQRSPMQLAAELVTQSQNATSELRQAPVFAALRGGRIAEDPFPGTKQDSWAGGVATLRPSGAEAGGVEGKKKKKTKAAGTAGSNHQTATGATPVNASSAQTQATPTTEATPRPPEHMPSGNNSDRTNPAVQQPPMTAQELAAANSSELPGGSILKDGGPYAGELSNGMRHGRGKQQYPNGDVFTGCFQQDKRVGIGRLDLADNGGFYLGEWKDDERSGKGSLTYGNKDMYVGTWLKGMREGKGKLLWASGSWYDGQFKKDEMHGEGVMQFQNQDRYEGQFFEGKMHGKGMFTSAGKSPRTGYWCMDEELVGKTEDEALLIIRESGFRGRCTHTHRHIHMDVGTLTSRYKCTQNTQIQMHTEHADTNARRTRRYKCTQNTQIQMHTDT